MGGTSKTNSRKKSKLNNNVTWVVCYSWTWPSICSCAHWQERELLSSLWWGPLSLYLIGWGPGALIGADWFDLQGGGGIDYIPNCATYSKWPVLYCACNVFFKLNVLWGYFAVVVTRSTNDRNKPNSGGSLEGESARLCLQWYRRWVTKLFRYGGDQFCQIFLSTLLQLPCCYLMLSLSPAYQQCKLLLLLFFSCTGLFLRRFAGGWSLSQKRSLHLPRCFKN